MDLAAHPYVTAGVALASASIIAAPVPQNLPEVHLPGVQLAGVESSITDLFSGAESDIASLGNGIGATDLPAGLAAEAFSPTSLLAGLTVGDAASNPWVELFTNSFANLQALANGVVADPLPVLHQVLINQAGYAATAGSAFQTFGQAAGEWFQTTLPAALTVALNDVTSGMPADAVTAVNGAIYDLLYQALPLASLGNIAVDMADNFYNAVDTVNSNLLIPLGYGAIPILFDPTAALGNSSQAFLDALDTGDYSAALGALLNAPAEALNAFLNGGIPLNLPGTGALLPETGLLSGLTSSQLGEIGGPIYSLMVSLPQAIAASIGGSTSSTAAASLTSLGGLSTSVADLGNVPDPGALAAAADNLFDPSAVAGLGSMLATQLAPNLAAMLIHLLTGLL
ncbi:hypothetical protein [Mycobacterium malmoense]|uniref:hypothetical protein n=1 Tax=Mycobacterium malmoense TaxID=1780 RepID=UPI00111C2C62|nr:hypothetical protein [Mycobacterium malmoense]UNB92802.1 hypothetical protein H5T25_14760 [Mycobacterium malmoense]